MSVSSSVSVRNHFIAEIDADDQRLSKMIQEDLKAYWQDPYNKVLTQPIRAIVYSVAIKTLSMFVSLIFPFIGYTIFGLSIALIDRIVYNNFNLFSQRIINCCKDFVIETISSARNRLSEVICDIVDSIPMFDEN